MSGSPPTAERKGRAPPRVPEEVLGAIDAHLKRREARREELYERSRVLRRLAQGTMARLHEGEAVEAAVAEVRERTRELSRALEAGGAGDEGIAHDAFQEAAEAGLLYAIVREEPLPSPEVLGVAPEAYLLGLGDAIGEVRRLVLGDLAHGRIESAEFRLALMEGLYRSLLRFDTTRAIVQLKPKQDAARSLLERTRGEVTMARVLARGPGRPNEGGTEEA